MKKICPECEKVTKQEKVSETYLCHDCGKEHETIIENKETCRECEHFVDESPKCLKCYSVYGEDGLTWHEEKIKKPNIGCYNFKKKI